MIPYLPLILTMQTGLQLNPLFTDGAVLQRGISVPIFGSSTPSSKITVEFNGQTVGTKADEWGKWQLKLKAMPAGGPYTLKVSCSNGETVTIKDILLGEVWVASGQSNMEFGEGGANDFARAVGETKNDIRMFTVRKVSNEVPQTTMTGTWEASSPTTIGHFSAVGLSFAREINRTLGVPVGIIHTSWGGTPAEAWTSRPTLSKHPNLSPMVTKYLAGIKDYPAAIEAYRKAMSVWLGERNDGSNEGFNNNWGMQEFNDDNWATCDAPVTIEKALGRDWDGMFWLRKSVDIPAEWVGKPLKLELGPIDDFDTTYFDNIRVGKVGVETADSWSLPRVYRIAPGVVRAGKNTIAIRVTDTGGGGGMGGNASDLKLSLWDGSASISLAGPWKYKVERELDVSKPRPQLPAGPGNPWAPGGLYNGMIAPIVPYGIKGAIWYQGESNADRATQYRELFPTMIQDWRKSWNQGNFPFLFVQLANYMARDRAPVESQWAELREAQSLTLGNTPNTGMAVIIDIGEAEDIHPKNKREVGRRLSLWALNKTYGKPMVYASPMYKSMSIHGDTIHVEFSNGSLLTTDGKAPKSFAIAGADKKFYWADARIDGSTVIVSSPDVKQPVAVRYAWANNPDVNLVNHAGLPASPFRTDGPKR